MTFVLINLNMNVYCLVLFVDVLKKYMVCVLRYFVFVWV